MLGRVKNEIRFAAAWDDRQVAGLKSQEVNSQVNNSLYLHCKFLILLWEKKYLNEHIIAHYVYFFTFHYSKTVWLAENLTEKKNYSLWENLYSYQAKIFSFWERVGKRAERRHFFCLAEINIISTEIHCIKTKPKNNYQKN